MSLIARAMTSGEKATVRGGADWSKKYLALWMPSIIYSARVNGVPADNDRVNEIDYDGGSGTLANVKVGMEMLVGTSAGGSDLGRVRLRKDPTGSKFYFSQTSQVKWAEDAYLTAVNNFGLWAKPVRRASKETYIDVDVDFSDQHDDWDPMVCMGVDEVLWLTGATVSAHFAASDSWVLDSTITDYLWEAPGASATANLDTATPTITYNAAGYYCVYCTVTADNGKSFTGVRHVFVFDDDHMPVTEFAIKANPIGSESSGGWSCEITLYDETAAAAMARGTRAILFARDWFGGVETATGPITNRENIKLVGRVAGENLTWDETAGEMSFRLENEAFWMQRLAVSGLELRFSKAAEKWSRITQMTVDKVLMHLLHWRTNASQLMDIKLTNDTKRQTEFVSTTENLWGQLQEASKPIHARPGVDRFGRLFVQVDPQMVAEASRTWATVMDVTAADYDTGISIARQTNSPCSQVRLSALQVNNTGTAVTRYSLAVGHDQTRSGTPETVDKCLCSSQAQANQQAGLKLGWRSNEWPDVPILLAQHNPFIDFCPRQFLSLALEAGGTPRGEEFDGNIIPRTIEWVGNEDGSWDTRLNCEAETFEGLNDDGDGPPIKPPDDPIDPPDDDPPDDPIDPDPGNPTDVLIAGYNSMASDVHAGLYFTKNFGDDDPEWIEMNEGLTETEWENVCRIHKCPSGLILIAILSGAYIKSIYYASALGDVWTKLIDDTMVDQGTYDVPAIVAFGVNPNKNEEIFVVGGGYTGLKIGAKNVYIGDRNGLSEVVTTLDITNYPGDVSYAMGKWLLTRARASALDPHGYTIFSEAGAVVANDDYATPGAWAGSAYHHRRGGKVFQVILNTGGSLRVISNNDPTVEVIHALPSVSGLSPAGRIAVSPSGARILKGIAQSPPVAAYKSEDYGETWNALSGASASTNYNTFENCETEDDFIGAIGGAIWFTPDFDTTWESRTGDLASINNLYIISHIKHIAG